MKRTIIVGLFIATVACPLFGQGKYLTNNGQITFFSHTAIEDITADNHAVASVIDSETGDIVIIVKMTEFQFEKKLMQEHFNENYVESEKFPKANFKGKILNNSEVDYTSEGTYKVMVKGELTIHGKTNELTSEGTIEVISTGIIARTKFMLNPADYDIKIPKVVRKNISERMELTIELNHLPI